MNYLPQNSPCGVAAPSVKRGFVFIFLKDAFIMLSFQIHIIFN